MVIDVKVVLDFLSIVPVMFFFDFNYLKLNSLSCKINKICFHLHLLIILAFLVTGNMIVSVNFMMDFYTNIHIYTCK